MNLYFLSFTICCITILVFLLFLIHDSLSSFTFRIKDSKEFLNALCYLGIALFIGIIICAEGCFYYFFAIRDMHCPNCHYEFKVLSNYDYCLQCGVKIKNKCDSCNRILLDNALAVCPYCGESIQTKVGELPTKVN